MVYDALRTGFITLGKTNHAEKEVASIMGGKILEFSADKYFDAGKDEGLKEGKKEGLEEGENNGKAKMTILFKRLLAEGKSNDMMRVLDDETYRELLLKRYAIS